MDTNDRQAIEGLFTKLDTVERRGGPRDAEAERFIAERIARQPAAPYLMAQTIVMQEMALENQQREMEALREPAARPQAEGGGGGFLAGAAQTAMGVAGGVLLGNALGSMFAGDAAAAEALAAEPSEPAAEDTAVADEGGGFDEEI